uniref:Uncharacterized protein n=1 Tax=Aegilops tauschii subsp. strangulata TaxID=200361 RepID=A0A453N4U1_AEGTS
VAQAHGFSVHSSYQIWCYLPTLDEQMTKHITVFSSDAIQDGFRWYTRRLRIDEDGDVADEFLDEVLPESSNNSDASPAGRFQVKYNTRPTALAMRKQTVAVDGDIRHCVEHQGQLQWV